MSFGQLQSQVIWIKIQLYVNDELWDNDLSKLIRFLDCR